MSLSDAEKLLLLELKTLKISRESLQYLTLFTFPEYEVNWHHEVIFNTLDRFVHTNAIPRLMIFAPPRHGKSEIISRRLPAFILGQNPDNRIIASSYSADLASFMNRDVQRIIESDRYSRLFPNTKLATGKDNYVKTADFFEIVGRRGYYRSAGVGGGITGQGADYLLLDDVIKNEAEANSPTYRQKVWDWYSTTAYTRLEKDAKVCLIMTRWHEDDLAGRLLEQQKNNPNADKWHVLNLPAIAEDIKDACDIRATGEALWPNKYNLERLEAIKASIGLKAWNALFQQRPSSVGGGMFKRLHWQYYYTLPDKFDTIVQSWDLTFKKKDDNDFVAGHVIGKLGANFYLLDRIKQRLSFTESLKAVRQLSTKWPSARAKLVEAKANGDALVDVLKNEIPGLILVEPKGGKIARAEAITPFHEARNFFLPVPSNAPWVTEFVEEHANFPNDKHDDDVDAWSQGVNYLAGDPRDRLKKLLGV